MKEKNKNIIIIIFVLIVIALVAAFLFKLKKEKGETDTSKPLAVSSSFNSQIQTTVDDMMIQDLKKNGYTLDDAEVYINPYGTSPLSALVLFKANGSGTIQVTVKGKHNNDLVTSYTASEYNYVPVYGLYPNYKNTVEISFNGQTKTFVIEPSMPEIPNGNVTVSNDKVSNNDFYFITSPLNLNTVAYDKYGDIRWFSAEYLRDIQLLDNGHFLIGDIDSNDYMMGTTINEIDYLGRVYKSFNVDNGYLGDIFLKNDGNILVASKKNDRDTYSDYIVELDGKTGQVVKTFDVFEILKNIDSSFTSNLDLFYFFNSGIEYIPEDDTLLLTYWGGEFVMSLKYSDGSLNWIFSNPKNFSKAFEKYLLVGDAELSYPMAMHSATLKNGILKVFDNGYDINAGNPNSAHLVGSYSSANTYKIDGKTISLVSSVNENKRLFSYALADYEIVNDNDEIILFGRELDNFDYSLDTDINLHTDLSSRLIERIDNEIALYMNIEGATYSVLKVDVSKGTKFTYDAMANVHNISSTAKLPITSDMVRLAKETDKVVAYEFGFYNNLLEVNIGFTSTDSVQLLLLNSNFEGAAYTIKEENKDLLLNKISVDIPKGKYTIYMYINGVMYKSNKFIEIK